MYRDMEALDPQDGEYIIRKQHWSAWQVAQLRTPLIIPDAVKRVLDRAKSQGGGNGVESAGDDQGREPPRLRDLPMRRRQIRMLEVWALVPRDKAEAFERDVLRRNAEGTEPGPETPEELGENRDYDRVEIFAVMAGDEIVAYEREPGPRPFHRFTWDTNNDTPDGRGVCDAVESEQKALNGAIRAMENNAKLLTNLMIAVKREMMKSDPEKAFDEGGIIELDEDCKSARDALQQIKFESVLGECVTIIEMFMEFADMSSQIPRAQQGVQSANPQTAFELQQRLEMAGKYLGNVVRRFDELIDWLVSLMHDYNQANTEIQDGKGPFTVKANGFTSFQNQVIRLNKLLQALSLAMSSPELSKMTRIRYLWAEVLKAQDIDPDAVIKSEDEIAQADQAEAESEERRLALAQIEAKAQADAAHARLRDAQAQKTESEIGVEAQRLKTDRARAVVDIEDQIKARSAPDAETGGTKQRARPDASKETKR
jgi:hypothetical protein